MTRRCVIVLLPLLAAGVLFPVPVFAQPGPPFMGGGTAFDPEPGVVHSGALLDAQVVVSHDRRYVTITTGATSTGLQDLVQFPVQVAQGPALGFVGGLNPAGDAALAAATGGVGAGGLNTSPSAIANQNSLLNRRGMFLLVPLE
jgi:hypothetical protein